MSQFELSKLRKAPGVLRRRLHFRLRPWTYKVNKMFPGAIRLSSSQTDRPDYNHVCNRAVRDDNFFDRFKSHPDYKVVLEHVSFDQGRKYLEAIEKQDPELLNRVQAFQKNDQIGSPEVHKYPLGDFSPTTLRYMKVLSDLRVEFGSLVPLNLIEIGPAYGGQCAAIALGEGFATYTGVDLPASLRLMRKYLGKLDIENVFFKTQEELGEQGPYDLVVSNYAISECRRGIQDDYIKKVLKHCPRGYITYNAVDRPVNERFEWFPYGLTEFTDILSKHHSLNVREEYPQTGNKTPNMLITWNEKK